jgi:hypothetical protein
MVKVPKALDTETTHVLGSKYKVIKWRGKKERRKSKESQEVQEEPYGYEEEEGSHKEEEGSAEEEEEGREEEEESSEEEEGGKEEEEGNKEEEESCQEEEGHQEEKEGCEEEEEESGEEEKEEIGDRPILRPQQGTTGFRKRAPQSWSGALFFAKFRPFLSLFGGNGNWDPFGCSAHHNENGRNVYILEGVES